jgi:hypothetical protein
MSTTIDIRHQEAAVLSKAVENVCRKLIRFLIGRISLVKLQEIIRYIFIEEIENKLHRENPTKNIPLTQLALLSGLDTRTLTKVRNSEQYRQPLYSESTFLDEFTPGASILDTWCSKVPYVDEESGEPNELDISGETKSFESLFNESTKSRGITYKSLMNRLIDSGSVELLEEKGKVKLITKTYIPSDSKDNLGSIEMGFSAIGNMIDTVAKNIDSREDEERLYQRGTWTLRLSKENQHELRSELKALLKETDVKARKIIESKEDKYSSPEQITAGISLFYFEEEGQKQ